MTTTNDEFHLYPTEDPTLYLAKRSIVSETSGRAVPDPDESAIRVRLPCVPPFVSEACRYSLTLDEDGDLNNDVARAVGCAGISCPPDAFDPAAIARRAVVRRTAALSSRLPKKDVPSYEKKLANVNAGLSRIGTTQKRVDGLCALIRENFRDDHETEAEVRNELSSTLGWFRDAVDLRGLGSILFSVGFVDRRAVSASLATTVSSSSSASSFASASASPSSPSSWFVPLGHGASDEFAESFAHLVERLSNDANEIRRRIEDAIANDPVAFFHATTRPVPFRELGPLDPTFYASHCSRFLGIDVPESSLERVAGGKGDGFGGDDVIAERRADVPFVDGVVAVVNGVTLRKNAASLLKDFARLAVVGALDVESETVVAETCRSRGTELVAANFDVSGDADAIEEVHVVCATQKVLLAFSRSASGACSRDDLRRRFLHRMGDRSSRVVDVYFRDAHLLSVDVLAHLVWRLGNRVTFGRVVLTRRFDEDLAYRGRAWDLLSHFASFVRGVRTVRTVLPLRVESVPRLDRESIASCRGFCVVPTVRDAEALLDTRDGGVGRRNAVLVGDSQREEWAYAVEPPLFGKVDSDGASGSSGSKRKNGGARTRGGVVTVRFPHKNNRECFETVSRVSPTTNAVNLRRCAKTRAGAIVIPVSSLAYYRERHPWAQGEATVFVPKTLGPIWTRDAVAAARGFFKRVRVVFVSDPEYSLEEDPGGRKNAFAGLVARVIDAAKRDKKRT